MGEFVGGPRDGEQFVVPGPLPPERITVLDTRGGPVQMWHPSRGDDVARVVCHLEDYPPAATRPGGPWRYLWPRLRADNTVAP